MASGGEGGWWGGGVINRLPAAVIDGNKNGKTKINAEEEYGEESRKDPIISSCGALDFAAAAAAPAALIQITAV